MDWRSGLPDTPGSKRYRARFSHQRYDFLDSYLLDPVDKSAHYIQILRKLPAGLSEWAVHPGVDNAELRAIEHDGKRIRQADLDFLMSQEAKDVMKEEGIILLDYRTLQRVWRTQ